MRLTSILPREAIISELKATDRLGVLRELARAFTKADPRLQVDAVFRVLEEREKLGSTGIGSGIAIPHGKLAAADKIIACFGRSVPGIDFQSQDGEPTHLFFALIAPENSAGLHLKVLAKLSRLLKDKGFREALMRATDQQGLFEILEKENEGTIL